MTGPEFLTSLILEAQKVSAVVPPRTAEKVYLHLLSEIGELGEEASIAAGELYKSPGADGVVGEAADVINCLADLLWLRFSELPPDVLRAACGQIAERAGIFDFDCHVAPDFLTAKSNFARFTADLRGIYAMLTPRSDLPWDDETEAASGLLRAVIDLAKAQSPGLTAEGFGTIFSTKCAKWLSKAAAA